MLTFINLGIHKSDPAAFSADSPSFIAFLNYSLMTLFGGETSALQPVSDVALIVKVIAAFVGVAILLALLVTVAITYRKGSQDAATQESIQGIRRSARHYETLLRDEYSVSVDEAIDRLERLGAGLFMQAITFLSSQLTDDSADPEAT
jgi:hypothetical protein